MRIPLIAATLLLAGVGVAEAQYYRPAPEPGWGPPSRYMPPPPPPGWGWRHRRFDDGYRAYPRRFDDGPRVRCWWRETPWGPRRVCRRAW